MEHLGEFFGDDKMAIEEVTGDECNEVKGGVS